MENKHQDRCEQDLKNKKTENELILDTEESNSDYNDQKNQKNTNQGEKELFILRRIV